VINRIKPTPLSNSFKELRFFTDAKTKRNALIGYLKKHGVINKTKHYGSLRSIKDTDIISYDPEKLLNALDAFNKRFRHDLPLCFWDEHSVVNNEPFIEVEPTEMSVDMDKLAAAVAKFVELAEEALRKNNFGRALELAENALGLEGKNIEASLIRAKALFKTGKPAQTASLLKNLLQDHPENEEAKKLLSKVHESYGDLHYSKQQYREAYLSFSEALNLNGKNRDAANSRLKVAKKIDDSRLVREAAAAVLKFGHDERALDLYASSTVQLAPELLQSDRFEETIKAMRNFMKHDKRYESPSMDSLFSLFLMAAKHLRSSGDPGKALSYLNEAALVRQSIDVGEERALEVDRERAFATFDLGRYKEAFEFFDLLVTLTEPTIPLLIGYGMTCLEIGKTKNAKRAFEKVLGLERFNKAAVFGLGKALFLLGYFGPAASYLSRVSKNETDFPEAMPLLLRCRKLAPLLKKLEEIKKSTESRNWLQQTQKADNFRKDDLRKLDVEDLFIVASVLRREKFWHLARFAYERILKLSVDDPDGLYGLGLSLYKCSDLAGAEEKFRMFLRTDPYDKKAFSYMILLLKKQDKSFELAQFVEERTRINPSPRAFVEAGVIMKKSGNLKVAKDYFEQASEKDENFHLARLRLIDFLVENREEDREFMKEALMHCNEGLVLAQKMSIYYFDFLYEKAMIYLKMKRRSDAFEILADIESMIDGMRGKSNEILLKLLWTRIRVAGAYLDSKNFSKCNEWLDKAKQLLPGVNERERRRAGLDITEIEEDLGLLKSR
jgi:tetratricopeptide (TPR) repeat protein